MTPPSCSLLLLLLLTATVASIHATTITASDRRIASFDLQPDDACVNTLNEAFVVTLDKETHFVVLPTGENEMNCLESHPGFLGYELDQPIYLAQNSNQMQINPPSWGLTRISQRELPLGASYFYPSPAGKGVNIYIMDTNGSSMDYHGHGTMAAGIAAGTLYGVAKEANVIAVKVLEDSGEGYMASILLGMSYIAERLKRKGKKMPVVIKMGALSTSAAGNGDYIQSDTGRDACSYSPASSFTTITVGAVDSSDTLASFSNSGNCTDIYAPGVDIGTIIPNGETVLASGTSFSAPHVAGVAALLYSQAAAKGILDRVTPSDIKNRIITTSTTNVLHRVHNSNDRLLYADVAIPPGFAAMAAPTKPTAMSWWYCCLLYSSITIYIHQLF
ncbi:peptidase S8/S53 domain-containing protein [Zychaea mexicana]|uniref:peptidase S8/S53 domain-containing protein n=1 Tax=Zychaea mexicana TaxID=64656 RepID=UPI0022FDB9B0|nr:peptidase S8/S53 domain-containing protein [Zychaea mexicana]KAI9489119.1 peptidase S8/S53 domain-containing protein [Zychaea mexicana]